MEMFTLLLVLSAIVLYFYRLALSLAIMDEYRKNPNSTINFSDVSAFEQVSFMMCLLSAEQVTGYIYGCATCLHLLIWAW